MSAGGSLEGEGINRGEGERKRVEGMGMASAFVNKPV